MYRHRGYWIGSRGRCCHVHEACRLQGIPASRIKSLAEPRAFFRLLGNAMSINVVQRFLVVALRAVGISGVSDPWTTGEAQRALHRDAISGATFGGSVVD